MNLKTFLDKAVQMETRKLLNIMAVMLLLSYIIVGFSGYMLGSTIMQKECFEYFAWYKVVFDCAECQKWSPIQLLEMQEYLTDVNEDALTDKKSE